MDFRYCLHNDEVIRGFVIPTPPSESGEWILVLTNTNGRYYAVKSNEMDGWESNIDNILNRLRQKVEQRCQSIAQSFTEFTRPPRVIDLSISTNVEVGHGGGAEQIKS